MFSRVSAKSVYVFLSLALIVIGVPYAMPRPWTIYADVWEQVAAMREFARHPSNPLNPLLALPGETSVRFTPYTLMWGMAARLFGWSTFTLLPVVAAVNLLLIVTGIWRLSISCFENRWLPTVWLVAMLWIWGKGYGQSNAYQLQMLLYTAPYIATFAYGLSFHALASLSQFLRTRGMLQLVAYTMLTVITFLSHPITAAFLIVAAGSMLLPTKSPKLIVGLQVVPLLCVVSAVVWPYFDYWHVLTSGSSESWFTTPHFESQFAALGPAVGGLLVVVYFVVKRRHPFVVLGAILCALIYAASYFLGILIGGRFILFGAIFLHLALALYVVEDGPRLLNGLRERRVADILAIAVLAVLVLWGARYRQRDVRDLGGSVAQWVRSGFSLHGRDVMSFEFLDGKLIPTDVLLAPSEYGLILPAITGAKVVAHIHGNPLMNDDLNQRCEAADGYYALQNREERERVLERYSATCVLYDKPADTWELSREMDFPANESPAAEGERFALYRVREN